MKRDLDLCRELMMAFEAAPAGQIIQTLSWDSGEKEYDAATVFAHIQLLIDAGFLEGKVYPDYSASENSMMAVEQITWAGHDFIDSARSEGVWNKAKERLTQAGSWTWSLALEVLKDEAKKQMTGLLS
ncbi:DUF2513 domain-containing protein [Prosthecobacter sp.]|uniref:DUF2513 domain-containing protein n=1 Tax=Prosthecobacter sp. TaxID=1965333 RepID=UPI003784B487